MSALRIDQLVDQDLVSADSAEAESEKLPCLAIRLGRTKTTKADQDACRTGKRRIASALFSAHGLRSGYLTETGRRVIPLSEACSNRNTARSAKPRATTTMPTRIMT